MQSANKVGQVSLIIEHFKAFFILLIIPFQAFVLAFIAYIYLLDGRYPLRPYYISFKSAKTAEVTYLPQTYWNRHDAKKICKRLKKHFSKEYGKTFTSVGLFKNETHLTLEWKKIIKTFKDLYTWQTEMLYHPIRRALITADARAFFVSAPLFRTLTKARAHHSPGLMLLMLIAFFTSTAGCFLAINIVLACLSEINIFFKVIFFTWRHAAQYLALTSIVWNMSCGITSLGILSLLATS